MVLGPFVDSVTGVDPEVALGVTQAECRLSKNGGAWAQKNSATAPAHMEEGWYSIPLSTTDTDTMGILVLAVYVAGALPVWREFQVVNANLYDVYFSTSIQSANVTYWNNQAVPTPNVTGVPNVDLGYWRGDTPYALSAARVNASVGEMQANVLTAAATAADFATEINTGMATAAAVAAVQADTDDIQTRLPAALESGRMAAQLPETQIDQIVNETWDEPISAHQSVVGSTGETLWRTQFTVQNGNGWDYNGANQLMDNPGTGNFKLNATSWSGTTQATFYRTTDLGVDASNVFRQLVAGDHIYIQNDVVVSSWAEYILTAGPTNNTDWWRFDLQHVASNGGVPGAGVQVWVAFRAAGAPAATEIADQVWDEPLAGHLAAGSTGEALNGAGAAGDPWTTVLPGAYGAGSAGNIIGNLDDAVAAVQADTDNIQTRLPAALESGRIAAQMSEAQIDQVVNETWDEDLSGHTGTPGGAGTLVGLTYDQVTSYIPPTIAAVQADTNDIQTRLPVALVGGKMDAVIPETQIDQIVNETWDETSADHVVTTSVGYQLLLAANQAPAVGLIADAVWDEALAGHAAAGSTGEALTDAAAGGGGGGVDPWLTPVPGAYAAGTAGNILGNLVNSVWAVSLASITGAAARSPLNALRFLRNKWSVADTTLTVTQEDDATPAWTATVTHDATAAPVTGNDPT